MKYIPKIFQKACFCAPLFFVLRTLKKRAMAHSLGCFFKGRRAKKKKQKTSLLKDLGYIYKSMVSLALLLPLALFAGTIHFAVIGDYGSNSTGEAEVSKLIKAKQPEFIITLGDNNYPNGCWEDIDKNIGQYYHRFIWQYRGIYGKGSEENQFYPALGNHDWAAQETCLQHGSLPYLEYFSLPGNGRYYDFVKGSVHFFVLDSDPHEPDGNTIQSQQYQWFKQAITHSNAPFKVVYFHHPPYSSGRHGPSEFMQWDFDKLGAQVVMSGHEHNYERMVKNNVLYLVNGLGGAHLDTQHGQDPDSQIFYSSHHGFLYVQATEKTMTIQLINDRNKVSDQIFVSAKQG